MKILIAASIIAFSSSAVMAESFAYERQFGTPELFPTLVGEQIVTTHTGRSGSTSFAYERQFDTPELFPTLAAGRYESKVSIGASVADKAQGHNSIWGWEFPVGG